MITYVHLKNGRKKILRPMAKLTDEMMNKRIAVYDEDFEVSVGIYLGIMPLSRKAIKYGDFVTVGCQSPDDESTLKLHCLNIKNAFGWLPLEDGEKAEDYILQQFKEGGQDND